MVPNARLRIATMKEAIDDVIIPALDGAESHVVDQARIVSRFLAILAEQLDHLAPLELLRLKDDAALLGELAAAAKGGAGVQAASLDAVALLDDIGHLVAIDLPPLQEIEARVDACRAALVALTEAAADDGDDGFRRRLGAGIAGQSEREAMRLRACSRLAGFEVDSQSLPQIGSLIADARARTG